MGNPIASIAGSVIGGMMNRSAAKKQQAAINNANAMSNQGYTDARPYITDVMSRGKAALGGILDTGTYQGDTYARMDPMQAAAYSNLGNFGTNALNNASGFMNAGQGFAQSYQNLFNQASQNNLGNAVAYATDPANYQPVADSVLRDARRNLEENTLRGIDVASSMSGNTNSSRAGVADAIAARGFADREADVIAEVQNNLMDRSLTEQQNRLTNMTAANQNLAGTYNTGFDQSLAATDAMTTAGGALRQEQQNILDDSRARFERDRDFEMNQLNAYNAGILGQAPRTPQGYTANYVDPNMAGLGGAIGGFGLGGKIANYFTQPQAQSYIPAGQPGSFLQGTYMGGFGGNNLI